MNFPRGYLSMPFFKGNKVLISKRFAILVFLTLSPFSAGIKGQHPDCDEEGFNETIDPRNCTCQRSWPCPKCQKYACFVVKCKSNVSDGTDIRCVSCGKGKNLFTEKNHSRSLFFNTRIGTENESNNEQSTISTSTVTATFSSLFNSIKISTTGTPFIPSLTPVPSRTPLTRPAGHDHPESLKWIKGMTSIMGVFSVIIVCGFLIYLLKKIRKNRRSRNLRQVDEVSFYRRRRLNGHCTHGAADGSRKNPGAVYSNKDHEVVTGDQLDNMAEKGSVQKGILSSLDAKPSNSTEKVADVQGENHRADRHLIPPPQPVKDNLGYSTFITDLPTAVIHKMCMLLDIERVSDDNDYRMLGCELGLTSSEITLIKQKSNNPSRVLLMEKFATKPNSGTLNHLKSILIKLDRYDVIQVIDKWVQNQTLQTN